MPKKVSDYTKLAVTTHVPAIARRRPEWGPDFAKELGAVHSDAEAHDRDYAKHRGDPDLAPVGRNKAIRKMKLEHVEKLDRRDRTIVGPLRARVAGLKAEANKRVAFPRPTDPADRVEFAARQREIRDSVRHLDPLERLNVRLGTLDPEACEALDSAPPVLWRPPNSTSPFVLQPLIDPDTVAAARAERIRQVAPEVAAEIEDLTALADSYAAVLSTVRAQIMEDLPSEVAEPKPQPQPTGDPLVDAGLVRVE
jgi:hypothetical protein